MAARATFALNAGVWFRRGRLLIISPVRGHLRRIQAETPLIDLFSFAEPALHSGNIKVTPSFEIEDYGKRLRIALGESVASRIPIYLDMNFWIVLRDAKDRRNPDAEALYQWLLLDAEKGSRLEAI
jgi:hypothetical protein